MPKMSRALFFCWRSSRFSYFHLAYIEIEKISLVVDIVHMCRDLAFPVAFNYLSEAQTHTSEHNKKERKKSLKTQIEISLFFSSFEKQKKCIAVQTKCSYLHHSLSIYYFESEMCRGKWMVRDTHRTNLRDGYKYTRRKKEFIEPTESRDEPPTPQILYVCCVRERVDLCVRVFDLSICAISTFEIVLSTNLFHRLTRITTPIQWHPTNRNK